MNDASKNTQDMQCRYIKDSRQLEVAFGLYVAQQITVDLIALNGAVLQEKTTSLSNGHHTLNFNLDKHTSVVLVRFTGNNCVVSRKVSVLQYTFRYSETQCLAAPDVSWF